MAKKNPIGRPAIRGFSALGMAPCCARVMAADPDPTAQPAADSGPTLQEVLVTAETYTSTAQSTPISISALTGGELEGRGIGSLEAIARDVPGLSMRSAGPGQGTSLRQAA